MATKKGKKKRNPKSDWIRLGFRPTLLPHGTSKTAFEQGMRQAIRSGELPAGWEVDVVWKNQPNGQLLSDDFESTMRNSRPQWRKLLSRALTKGMARMRGKT